MILACQRISKAFGTEEVLKEISFHIEEREKAAIVGINGAGKSTLLKIIMGELEADSGQAVIARDVTVGYLAQHQEEQGERTVYEEMLDVRKEVIELDRQIRALELEMKHISPDKLPEALNVYTRLQHEFEQADGYRYRSEIAGVLKGLGFPEEDWEKPVRTLSGGQKTRVALGRLLLSAPDVILLDEPTNHLDMESIRWLENYLLNYNGAVVVVCHDRYFLDKVVTKVIEIDQARGRVYAGNYSAFMEKRAALFAHMRKEYENQQRELRHQDEVIARLKSFNREKSVKRAESREKMRDKIQLAEKPTEARTDIRMKLEPGVQSGEDVLTVKGLGKAFGRTVLFQDLSFSIKRGEKVALIGKNGTGKTTILKILNRLVPKDSGTVLPGANVQIGYFDQEHQILSMQKTIYEEISDAYPKLTTTKIRNTLAAFLFFGDDVMKQIGELSGGERGRVSLARLMLSNANFLLLDEPTNHLDIHSKEILEEALRDYTGTVLYVSHDRYFINRTATRVLELSDGRLTSFLGNYDDYVREKEKMAQAQPEQDPAGSVKKNDSAAALSWKQEKQRQARERKRSSALKKAEERIFELEEELEQIRDQMNDPENGTDAALLMELAQKEETLSGHLEAAYEEWERWESGSDGID